MICHHVYFVRENFTVEENRSFYERLSGLVLNTTYLVGEATKGEFKMVVRPEDLQAELENLYGEFEVDNVTIRTKKN